jgi:excisionase family DNA binding protein
VKEPLWTPEDLADYLVVPVDTVYGWNYKGSGPRPIAVGRHVRYRGEDIQAWLELRSVGRGPSMTSGSPEEKTRRCRSVTPGPSMSTGSLEEKTRRVRS